MKRYLYSLSDDYQWKLFLSILFGTISVIEGFYGSLLWGFLALFTLDSITGVLRSKHQGVPISSNRLRSSVNKLCAYMLLLTALIITSKYEQSFVPVVAVTYYYYMFTEFKSILENVGEMGVKVPSFLNGKVDYKLQEYDKVDKKD